MIAFDVGELEEWSDHLKGVERRIQKETFKVRKQHALLMAGTARRKAPHDTGFLRKNIKRVVRGRKVSVNSEADYSLFVEKGHWTRAVHVPRKFVPPQPFMKPAIDKHKRGYYDDLARTAAFVVAEETVAGLFS